MIFKMCIQSVASSHIKSILLLYHYIKLYEVYETSLSLQCSNSPKVRDIVGRQSHSQETPEFCSCLCRTLSLKAKVDHPHMPPPLCNLIEYNSFKMNCLKTDKKPYTVQKVLCGGGGWQLLSQLWLCIYFFARNCFESHPHVWFTRHSEILTQFK